MPPKSKRVAGKRHPLNMRTTKELRELIEEAAQRSGRSLVQEVEYRLERSFVTDEQKLSLAHRDTQFVDFLSGADESAADILRWLAFEFQTHPDWNSIEGRKRLADAFPK